MKKIRRGGGDKGDSDDGGGDEGRKRAEEQKENYISWLVLEDLLLPPFFVLPFPTTLRYQRPASSTKFNLVALLLPSRNPLLPPLHVFDVNLHD